MNTIYLVAEIEGSEKSFKKAFRERFDDITHQGYFKNLAGFLISPPEFQAFTSYGRQAKLAAWQDDNYGICQDFGLSVYAFDNNRLYLAGEFNGYTPTKFFETLLNKYKFDKISVVSINEEISWSEVVIFTEGDYKRIPYFLTSKDGHETFTNLLFENIFLDVFANSYYVKKAFNKLTQEEVDDMEGNDE